MRKILSILLLVLVSILIVESKTRLVKQDALYKDYNVVLITLNSLRADSLSCYGYRRKTTPATDEIAKSSFVFENAFSSACVTLPSLMSIFTSLYPNSHGVLHIFKDQLPSRIYTLAEILKIYGYKNSWFGANRVDPHLGLVAGSGRGFDSIQELVCNGYDIQGKDAVFSWLEENKQSKFFLTLSVKDHSFGLHDLRFPLPDYRNKFLKAKRGAVIESEAELDEAFYFEIINALSDKKSFIYQILNQETILANAELFNGKYAEKKLRVIEALSQKEFLELWQSWPKEVGSYFSKIDRGNKRLLKFRELWETKITSCLNKVVDTQEGFLGLTKWWEIKKDLYFSRINKVNRDDLEYLKALYDACILRVDQDLIKPLILKLKELKVYNNTILVITADHGIMFGEHGALGHPGKFYDEVIHVPLIIRVPYLPNKGRRVRHLVQGVDIMPTILELLGIALPYYTQGKSLVPLMKNKKNEALHEYVYGQVPWVSYLRSLKWKLIVEPDEYPRLYNLEKDPHENINSYQSNRKVGEELEKKLKEWDNTLPRYQDKEYPFLPYVGLETQRRIRKTGYW